MEMYWFITHSYCVFTIEPRYGDAFKEHQEQQTHSTGGIVVKEFEHIEATLSREERIGLGNRSLI